MSSVTRALATNTKSLPDVQYAGGPSYIRSEDPQKLLFPFVILNGALELQLINEFDITSTTPPLGVLNVRDGNLIRRMGGLHLVEAIGPLFKTYIQNVIWQTNDDPAVSYKATNIRVYAPGLVTRVQQLSSQNLPIRVDPDYSYVSSGIPPQNFILDVTGYGTTYAFEKPLILSVDAATYPGNAPIGKQYITFYTAWDR
jgi:hypothetical protein